MEAGNSLEQAVALVAAANKVVQDPSSVGSALRTISLRLRGTSVEILEEMGEETDGVVESTSKLQEKLKALTGVDILTDAGAYKDTYTILREIGEVWKDLDPMDQAAALELMAGKNRANTLAAILNNMEDLKGAYQDALGAEGSAMRENATYLDSIQGRIDLFNNSLQTMWMNFLNTDAVKFIVDLGTGLLKLVDSIGLIETALAAIMGYFTLIKKVDWTQGFGAFFGKGNKTKLLKGKALDDEMLAFNTALSQGPEAFGAYTQGAKEAGNGMDILADKVARGNIQLVNGKVTSQQYTAALKSQSSAAQQAAKKQKLINTAVMLTTMAISGIISAIQSYADSIKTVEERYDELQSSISTIEGDINSLDSDLGTIQEQIDALSNKPLTIADAEELRKLKEQSAELQRQKELKESMLDAYKVQDEAASLEMFNQIIKTTAANQEKAAETGKTWGKILGTIADVALVAGGIFVTGLSGGLATAAGAAMMGAGMSGLGSSALPALGEWMGSSSKQVGEDLESWYESYATAIEEANKKAAEAEAEYLSNVTDENYDAWQKKLEAANTLQQELYTNLEKLRGYVDGLEYNDTTKATIDGFNNLMTKISLQGIGDDAQSQISHIQSLEEEFKELSKGVDENGKNIALSADEYARYQSILSQILGLTPSLIQGYNDEGQAIVNKNNLIAESIALLQKQNKVAAQSLLLNDDSHILSSYDSSQSIYDEKIAAAKNVKDPFSDQVLDEMNARVIAEDIVSRVIGQVTGDKYLIGKESLTSYMVDNADAVSEHIGAMIAEFATWESKGNVDASETKEFALYLQQIVAQVDYARMATWQFKQTLSQIPQASDYYDDLSGSHLAFINAYIDSLDNLENLTDDEILAIRDSIYMLTNAIGQDKNKQDLINSLFEVDTSLAAQVYCNTINSILQQIVDTGLIDEDVKNNILMSLIPDKENLESMLTEVKGKLKDEHDGLADDLSFAELKIAYKFVADKESGSVTGDELKAALAANIPENITIVYTYSELIEQATSYNEILQQTAEYINNNTVVTEEYKKSLEGLGIDKAELAKCFDDENKLVVTNSVLLNKLVKNAKGNIAANVKLAKSQSQLQYYKLYKEMDNLIDISKSTDGATLSYVDSLYEQMAAIEKTISKYSLLEAKLLGAANAYEQLEAAKEQDTENDYGSKAEELVNALAEAFNTAELGTQAAQVAIAGLIPESEIDKAKTLDEQMQQIYDYMTTGTLSKLFTIEFDDEGGISSVEMTRENVQKFTEELINAGKVFHGTWDEFTLDASIDDLDSFAKAIGVTKEVAFAYLTELEKFDINWLGGDYDTLLEQLMSGDLEYAIMKNMKDLADLEYRAAHGEFKGKESAYNEERDKLEQKRIKQQQEARKTIKAWSDTTAEIEAAQAEVDKLIADGASDEQIKAATNKLYNLQYALSGLEEPTEIVLQFASENIQTQIGQIKQQLDEAGISMDEAVQLNKETGKYEVVYTGTFDKTTLDTLAGLKNEELAINNLLNGGITTVEGHLSNISTAVSGIYSILGGKEKSGDDNATDGGKKTADTVEVTATEANGEGTAAGGSSDTVGQQYEDPACTTGGGQDAADKGNDEFDSKISDLNSQLKSAQEKVSQLETSIETLKAEKTALEADMEAAKSEADSTIAKLTDKKAAADETIAQLTAEIATLETAMNTAKAESDAAIAQLNTEKTQLEASVAELTSAKAEADATIAQLTSDKASLETSIANANVLIAQLETEKADLNTAIAASEANIAVLSAEKADVESDMAEAKAMLSQTEAMLAEAKSALDAANNDLSNANDLITSLTSTNQNLESQVTNLNAQLNDANAALVNAQAEKTAADATIAKLESALSDAEATIEALSAETNTAKSEEEEQDWNWGDEYGYDPVIPAEVDLDTTAAEDKLEGLGDDVDYGFSIGEILHDEGLSFVPDIEKAFYKFGKSILFDSTIFSQILKEAEYAEEDINNLIAAIQTYENVVTDASNPDPLGLNDTDVSIESLMHSLDSLGVAWGDSIGMWADGKRELFIDVPALIDVLKGKGWTDTAIQSYLNQLSYIDFGKYLITPSELSDFPLDALINKIFEIPEDKTTNYEVAGDGESEVSGIGTEWANVPETKTTHYTIYKTTIEQTKKRGGLLGGIMGLVGLANGTAHAQGTAHKGGSWGASKTETALTGELGPELRVRGNRWELLGENGAEFNEVRKGDIIFNHKQTEQLLTNGYITGRGKAFAEGTIGGSAFAFTSESGVIGTSAEPTVEAKDVTVVADTTSMTVTTNGTSVNTFDDKATNNNSGNKKGGGGGDKKKKEDEEKEIFDWIEVKLEEIEEAINLHGARLENAIGSVKQNAIIDNMIGLNKDLYNNLVKGANEYYEYANELLKDVPEEYRKAAQNGQIAIEEFAGDADKKTLEAIQKYREWVQKGADVTQRAEEVLTEIQNLAKQAIDNIAQEYENKASIPGIVIEQLEAYNALIETTQGAESAKIYEEMIKENNKQIGILAEQRKKMQSELNAQVEAGNIKKYSQAWYDAVGEIAAVDTEILNLTADTEDYRDTINELHWDHFDNLISRFEAISDEAENLIDILSNKDLVNKDTAEWTDEGITSLGLYAQKMEVAEMQAKKYNDEIQYLNNNWKKLGYTEQEYIEKLEELKNGQYDAIKSYNDTKKAIVDLTKERVDAIKEGIEKEIEAYEELISKKKEELDAEKDLYDFQKGVANQQKEIADIERKLAALSADNSASARAKRARLEAELAEARQELEDTYYDRSVSNQQEALDKELEAFQEEKDKEIEGWDKYLEDTERVVSDGLATIQSNTDAVYNTLKDMGEEYSLSIAAALTSPWKYGEDAIQSYSEKFKMDMSKTVEELREIAAEHKKLIDEIEAHGSKNAQTVNSNVDGYQDATYVQPAQQPETNQSDATNNQNVTPPKKGSSVKVKVGTTHWGAKSGGKKMADFVPGRTYTVSNVVGTGADAQILLSKKDQNKKSATYGKTVYMGWINLKDLEGYASGTTGVKNSQFAWIDELGEELVIRPSNGRMTFMEKGTGVIPADLTSNLMEWGELDPSIMLERNKPVINAPHITNNNMEINMEIAEVVHIDTVTNDTIPNLTKAIEKQMDKYMKNVNNNIRKYTR